MAIVYVDVNGAAGAGTSAGNSTNVVPTTVTSNTTILFNSDNGIQTMPLSRGNSLTVSGNNVVIGSYGSTTAVVSGFQQVTGGWTTNSGTVAQRSWTPASGVFGSVINMSDLTGSPQGTVLNWGNATDGSITPSALPVGYYAYNFTTDIMYVNLGVNLATTNAKTFGLAACGRFVTASGTPTTVEIANLRIIGFGQSSVNASANSTSWHIHDNQFYANGGNWSGTTYLGTGIQCGTNANHIEIDNNWVVQTFDSPISPQHFGSTTGELIDHIHIHHNTLTYGALAGVEVSDFGTGNVTTNVEIDHNIITGMGLGFSGLGHSQGGTPFCDGIHWRGDATGDLSGLNIHDNTIQGYDACIGSRNNTGAVTVTNNRLSSARYGIYNTEAAITITATLNDFCANSVNDVDDVNQTPNTLLNGGTYSGNTTSATQCLTPAIPGQGVQAETTAFTLLAAAANYNYQLASALRNAILDANSITFAYAGNPVVFLYSSFSLAATGGSYAYTGKDVTFTLIPNPTPLTANAGIYSYTGKDADLFWQSFPFINADAGAYTYTGSAANLTATFPPPVGTFPNVVGLTVSMAQQSLEASGAIVTASIGYFGDWPVTITWVEGRTRPGTIMQPGIVVAQTPAAGSVIVANAPIVLTVTEIPLSLATPPSQANF